MRFQRDIDKHTFFFFENKTYVRHDKSCSVINGIDDHRHTMLHLYKNMVVGR